MDKLRQLFKSRKFWAAVVSILAGTGFVGASGLEEAEVLQAIMVVVTLVSYIIGTAIEDNGRNRNGDG